MRKTAFLIASIILITLAGYAIARADDDKESILMTLNQLGAQVQLLDSQIKGLLEKRQEINRLIGNGQRRLFDIKQAEKAAVPEPKE